MGHRHGNLNSKGKWGACNIPRLRIEKEEFAKQKDDYAARIKREKEDQELKDFINSKKPREYKGAEEPLPDSQEVAPANVCNVDVWTVGGDKNDRGIDVRGGKYFKVMASAANVHNQNVTPKRKQENVDFVNSPTDEENSNL